MGVFVPIIRAQEDPANVVLDLGKWTDGEAVWVCSVSLNAMILTYLVNLAIRRHDGELTIKMGEPPIVLTCVLS